ncbi:MAG TPA: flagellar cap protein FliD N-terminal domain-containing protein, partial [Tepidisphaeraceae bacterium]|nr:flagellar cap protein FliD N-terminal domain-containing protein [Tepidisphaeraceae bacterium]
MSGISSGIGLVSGINSRDIIDQLMTLEARPKTRLQGRIDRANEQRIAYTGLSTKLTGMRLSATVLKKPSTFTGAQANSSNEDIVTASASNGAAVGSYQVRVARLVTSQQLLSRGFGDFDTAKVGAGTITVEMGGGELNSPNNLNDLNGGAGVQRGVFRITDRSGATAIIDTSDAVTLDDVVKRINNSLGINVRATIDGDKLTLSDLTGATTANLTVQDLGETKAATSLGIAGSVAAATLAGTQINTIGNGTALSLLNDGRGVRTTSTGNDLTITFRDGTTAGVSLANTRSLGDVMQRIREAGGGAKINASVAPDGKSLLLTDLTGGGGTLPVAAIGTSKTAADLGILGSGTGATLTGTQVVSSLGTVNLSALKGGAGLTLGTISVTNRAGANNNINLSSAKTVADVIRLINDAGAGITASLNGSANGIALTDTTGGTGNLVIANSRTPASAPDL